MWYWMVEAEDGLEKRGSKMDIERVAMKMFAEVSGVFTLLAFAKWGKWDLNKLRSLSWGWIILFYLLADIGYFILRSRVTGQ